MRLHGNIFILATQDPTGGMKFFGVKLLSDACNQYFFLSWDEIQLFHVVSFNLFRSNIFQNRIFFNNTLSLQMVSWNIKDATQIYGCKSSFEITTRLKQKYLSNTLYHKYAIHGCKCSSKKYSIHLKIRDTVPCKKLFPAIKHSNLHRISFGGATTLDSSLFLISCFFTKIFVHLSVIAEVCHFSVYKLIGCKHLMVPSQQ